MNMRRHINILSALAIVWLATTWLAACTEDPSRIGVGLQDPATLYDGKHDTIALVAHTLYEDSLRTSGYSSAVIGAYDDETFGAVRATYYTQITNPNGIAFDAQSTIDSVVLSLSISDVYPPVGDTCRLHFRVDQLASAPLTDSGYYAFDSIPIGPACFFDGVVTLARADTMVARLRLAPAAADLFANQTLDAQQLIDHAKGLRVALLGNDQMVTVNLAAEQTNLVVHYRYDTIVRTVSLGVGIQGTHFSHFSHNYASSALARFATAPHDSLAGAALLYLEPLGGTYLSIDMHAWLDTFRTAHPNAVVHYAVLRLPIAMDASDPYHPAKMQTYKRFADGSSVGIPDMLDAYAYTGYDGTNSLDSSCYRIRVTQHLQKLLRTGRDYGTLVYLDGRRSDPRRVVINGTAHQNPIRVEVVYTE